MRDIEIYQLATDVISSITNDFQSSVYSSLNGTLSIVWSQENKVNAWASSEYILGNPPNHKIYFTYELVRQVYRDIEMYCEYIESNIDQEPFKILFQDDVQPFDLLTTYFSKEAYVNNMFMGAITWIYFHELGHLQQEHGYIRSKFVGTKTSSIHECSIKANKKIRGKKANIFHITEIAADFEAVNSCIFELYRQFKGEELKPAIYVFMCGISCVLYRFHGSKSFVIEKHPVGSHPNPLIRLENIVPQVYEYLSLPGLEKFTGTILKREDIVKASNVAATTVGLLWLRNAGKQPNISDNYFLMGSLSRPGMKKYLNTIIKSWDTIEPTIRKIRRFGNSFGLLRFSEEIRKRVNPMYSYQVILRKHKLFKFRRTISKRVRTRGF